MSAAALVLPPGPDSGTHKPPQEHEQGHSWRRKKARSCGKEQRDVNIRGRCNKERILLHLAFGPTPNPPVESVAEEKGVTLDSSVSCITEGAGEHEVAGIQALDPATHAFSLASRDEKADRRRDTSTAASPEISRKHVATQMSPGGSSQSSPRGVHSPPPTELQSHFLKLEVRDVQVNDRVTVTRWSKKQVARGLDKGSTSIVQWKKRTVESKGPAWEVTETEKAKRMSKLKKEEASITAWENFQKAKAESEIRKLEMKLEKKRSSSMDKILNKLKSAQRKAQEMRIVVTENQAQLAASTAKRTTPFRRADQSSSLGGCFSCHAF